MHTHSTQAKMVLHQLTAFEVGQIKAHMEHGLRAGKIAAKVLDHVTHTTLYTVVLLELVIAWHSHARPLGSLSEPFLTYF